MLLYTLTFIFFFIGAFYIDKASYKEKNIWYFLECLFLILIAGFRYKIGGDTHFYMQEFYYLPDWEGLSSFNFSEADHQPLWYVLNAFSKSIYNNFYFFQIVHAILINSLIFKFFKQQTDKYLKGVLIYYVFFFLFYNTEILRASISICIFLFSYNFLMNKKWVKYYICCIIAYGFHNQALILFFFPVYHLIERKSIKTDIFAFAIILSIYFSSSLLLDFSDLLSFSEFAQKRFLSYVEQDKISFNIFGLLSNVLKVLFVLLLYYMMPLENKKKPFFIYFAIGCTLLSLKFYVVFGRLQDFVNPILILYILNILKERKQKSLKSLLIICMIWSWGNLYIWKINEVYAFHKYYPYSTWLYPEEDILRDKVTLDSH